ncbi:MAG: hypothetical protein FWH03_08575 [Firmicutes bacterium]|nr:hypothetical protein [Bacillota bacterium]
MSNNKKPAPTGMTPSMKLGRKIGQICAFAAFFAIMFFAITVIGIFMEWFKGEVAGRMMQAAATIFFLIALLKGLEFALSRRCTKKTIILVAIYLAFCVVVIVFNFMPDTWNRVMSSIKG